MDVGDSKTPSVTLYTHQQDPTTPAKQTGPKQEILSLTEKLLSSIAAGDFDTYKSLVDTELSCFEPETAGNMMRGLEYHRFYFDTVVPKNKKMIAMSILNPTVHMLGSDAACIVYTRFTQYIDRNDLPHSTHTEETRIWNRKDGKWINVHFHRSAG